MSVLTDTASRLNVPLDKRTSFAKSLAFRDRLEAALTRRAAEAANHTVADIFTSGVLQAEVLDAGRTVDVSFNPTADALAADSLSVTKIRFRSHSNRNGGIDFVARVMGTRVYNPTTSVHSHGVGYTQLDDAWTATAKVMDQVRTVHNAAGFAKFIADTLAWLTSTTAVEAAERAA